MICPAGPYWWQIRPTGRENTPGAAALPFRDCNMGAVCLAGKTHAGQGGPDRFGLGGFAGWANRVCAGTSSG